MLPEMIELQQAAVAKLKALVDKNELDVITFRAPTGSGKTFMMADFMNQILSERSDTVFLVSSLSKSDLAEQNYNNFCQYIYEGLFVNLKPRLISSESGTEERIVIPTDYNVYLLPRDLYKERSKLMQGSFVSFLLELLYRESKRIIWIKDECHIATKNLDGLADKYFSKTINFSATPKLSRGQRPDVEITDEEAEKCGLIKKVVWGDENLDFASTVDFFKSIRSEYRDLLGVNPCLIVQISNKDKADEEVNNVILPVLNSNQDIKWMLIVDDPKQCNTNDVFKAKKLPVSEWKNYAKNDLSDIDIIIFKMVISEGWDIPRACMIYQARNSRSQQLDEQVLGRVRRNPRLKDFESLNDKAKELALTAWAWGINKNEKAKVFAVRIKDDQSDITNSVKIKTTRVKTLSDKKDFKIDKYLDGKPKALVGKSIFTLHRNLSKADTSVQQLVYDYIGNDVEKWFKSTENIDDIARESNMYMCDYSSSMELSEEESFPAQSYYIGSDRYVHISNWIWQRRDGSDRFSFDSEAEREWADRLKDISSECTEVITTGKKSKDPNAGLLNVLGEIQVELYEKTQQVYLWGKNYVPNSAVRFEYYLNGIYNSYPDFILKDKFDRIHLFEVKSLNQSSSVSINSEEYKTKIEELKKCYKQASLLTKQCFYLPVLNGESWHIISFVDGKEQNMSFDELKEFIKQPNS